MGEHYQAKKHRLFMELNTAQHRVYCCEENVYALNDNARGEVFLIRRLLRQVQDLEDDERRTRRSHAQVAKGSRWKIIGTVSQFAIRLKYFRPEMSARYVVHTRQKQPKTEK